MVAQDEGEPAQPGTADVTDWDAGWDSDEKEQPQAETPTRQIPTAADKEPTTSNTHETQADPSPDDDDDAADAWGWGDDDATDEPISDLKPVEDKQQPKQAEIGSEMREVTLSEPYWISSIPKPVFDIIKAIYDDGAELTKAEYVCT